MARRTQWKLTIKQGETLMRHFRLRNPATGAVLDLDEVGVTSGTLVIRPTYGEDAVVTLTTANGGIVIEHDTKGNGWEYSGYLTMTATATGALASWGDGVFDFELSDGVHDRVVASGIATLSPSTIA